MRYKETMKRDLKRGACHTSLASNAILGFWGAGVSEWSRACGCKAGRKPAPNICKNMLQPQYLVYTQHDKINSTPLNIKTRAASRRQCDCQNSKATWREPAGGPGGGERSGTTQILQENHKRRCPTSLTCANYLVRGT